MRKFFAVFTQRDPREQVALVLGALALVSLIPFPKIWFGSLIHLLGSLVFALVVDFLLTGLRQKKWIFPRSALVTGFLIGLILDPSTPLWMTFLTAVFAISSKQLIRLGQHHIFNPAAFGLVISSFLFQSSISWWAVSATPVWSIAVLVIGMSVVLQRLRLLWMPVGFLGIYMAYLLFWSPSVLPIRLLDSSLFLFVFVMLPEYRTSPVIDHWRYSFGFFVGAIFMVLFQLFHLNSPDPLLVSLLLADLLSFLVIKSQKSSP